MVSRKFPPIPIALIRIALCKKQQAPSPAATPKAKRKSGVPIATPHDQILIDASTDLAAALDQEGNEAKPRRKADPWKRSPSRRNGGQARSLPRKKQNGS